MMKFTYSGQTIRVNMADHPALLAEITRRMRSHEGFALATINLDHLVKLRHDPGFRDAYAAHDLVVADGNPIVWLSRLARRPVTLVTGSDLVLPLTRLAAVEDVPIALLGTTDQALAAASASLLQQVPGARIVARIAPPMGFDPDSPAAGGFVFLRSAPRNRNASQLADGAKRPPSALPASGPGLIFCRATRPEHRCGCADWRWNGRGG